MGNVPVILMCVGATKAGTTWLHDQLSAHPDCFLRTIKEYHYFSTTAPAHWDKKIQETSAEIDQLSSRGQGGLSADQQRRLADLQSWLPIVQRRAVEPAVFAQYLRAGAGAAKLVGDFTPAYSIMSGKGLKPMLDMGAVKILYLMRDPLARLWSHVRMVAQRAAPDATGEDQFAATCAEVLQKTLQGGQEGIVRRGDYASNLPKLQRIFGPRLMVMFTEDMLTKAGFDRLLAFLGLGPMQADLTRRVHEGRALAMPAALRAGALRFLRPQYDFIADRFADVPQAWQAAMAEFTTAPTTHKVLI